MNADLRKMREIGMVLYHPLQPIYIDNSGVARFKRNRIIDHLFKCGILDLNSLTLLPFHDEDRMQLAQLLGYSVSGFGSLSYADTDVVAHCDKIVASLHPRPYLIDSDGVPPREGEEL